MSKTLGCYIRHAGNDGEFAIPGATYHADGFDPITNTIMEPCTMATPKVFHPESYSSYLKQKNGDLSRVNSSLMAVHKQIPYQCIDCNGSLHRYE